ncbi:two-component system, chemotaxis family, response regulator CheB [Halobacillus alkaliphilus]|uniref:protein-glutamate methylesterase n=1 Tax=Halobacillus alkaliphilus TaxID=396056 RepID=A0A1I2KWL2_9BACI|nr:chemotaxis protein CheB [Halobacillus alkaliphilus]SFF70748.1 two-component system, chemotaxis family, response regulator CheB [Halobacillus alkaliphilus]
MTNSPIPVLIVSNMTKQGSDSTIKPAFLGAIDLIEIPSGSISLSIKVIEQQLLQIVLIASRAKVNSYKPVKPLSHKKTLHKKAVERETTIVTMGTSTGGPGALQEVFTQLPADLDAPLVIVQHMPKGFTKSLAERLNKSCLLQVKEAEHGEELKNGTAYITPGGYHIQVMSDVRGHLYFNLDESAPLQGHRPALDRLLVSLAVLEKVQTISVVMTGMGADGRRGLQELKRKHPQTYSIVESEESCIVFGMPYAIIEAELADEVIPLSGIGSSIIKALRSKRGKKNG